MKINKKKIFFFAIIFFGFLGWAQSSHAADIAVGSTATGNGSGSDWNNIAQWNSLSFVRGNVYYLQDGTYTTKNLNTPVSGTDYIFIKKAVEEAHGPAVGWSSEYGSGTADFLAGAYLNVSTSYWEIDGVTGGGVGSWTTGHGITFNNTAGNAISWIFISTSPISNINIRHCKFTQTGDIAQNATFANAIYQNGTLNNSIFEYLYIDNISGLPFFLRFGTGDVFQYNYTGDVCGVSSYNANQHCEVLVQWGLSDIHFRYNYVEHTPSSGGIIKNDLAHGVPGNISDSFRIYGNVFEGAGDGIPISCNDGQCSNWTIINNTFHDIVGGPFTNGGAYSITNLKSRNNIIFSVSGMVTHFAPYNWYSQLNASPNKTSCQTNADATQDVCIGCASGCDTVTQRLDPFVNSAGSLAEDFVLSGPIVGWSGVDFCALDSCAGENKYNIDVFGNTRGADGVWDRGAYEFVSGVVDIVAPAAPSGLSVM